MPDTTELETSPRSSCLGPATPHLACLPSCLPTHPSIPSSTHPPTYLSTYLSINPSYLPIYTLTHLYIQPPTISTRPSAYLSTPLSIRPSMYLPPIYLPQLLPGTAPHRLFTLRQGEPLTNTSHRGSRGLPASLPSSPACHAMPCLACPHPRLRSQPGPTPHLEASLIRPTSTSETPTFPIPPIYLPS